jgi:hypothetical protein
MTTALPAFAAVDFQWTRGLRDIWSDAPFHVEDLNGDAVDRIAAEFFARTRAPDSNPVGQVLTGRAGAGKTHLLGALRRRVWEGRGWFVLIDMIGINDFWRTAALGFLQSLSRITPSGQTQANAILSAVLRRLNSDPSARRAVAGQVMPTLTKTRAVELLIAMLGAIEPAETRKHQDILRAMALLDSQDMGTGTYAATWLLGHEVEDARRREHGFVAGPPPPAEIVRGLLWIMGLAGPTLIAVDQFDAIVSEANAVAAEEAGARRANSILQSLAGGLMHLHDLKRRAMTLVSCLEATWPVVKEKTVATAADRFRELPVLPPVASPAAVERLIGLRLAPVYAERGFAPPYPTYPFTRGAIESAVGLRPRAILMRCQEHQEACLAEGRVRDCGSLAIAPPRAASAAPQGEIAALDEAFAWARAEAPPVAFDDEAAVGALVSEACDLYLRQLSLPETVEGEASPDPNPRSPALHARLVFVFHEEDDRQRRWGFRAIEQDNPIAFQSRLRAAMTASGVDANLKWRRLLVLRTCPPPPGPKSAEVAKEFLDAGGDFVEPAREDFEIFAALSQLAKDAPPGFDAWLKLRKPLFATRLFYVAGLAPPEFLPWERMGYAQTPARMEPPPAPRIAEAPTRTETQASRVFIPPPKLAPPKLDGPPASPVRQARALAALLTTAPRPALAELRENASVWRPPPLRAIPVGRAVDRGGMLGPVALPLDMLPRHVAILGDPGAGKSVLLSRLVEEAALLGVPTVALDVDNDLARLAQPWPSRPTEFSDEDARKAKAYFERADVVVWTPGVVGGRPLNLKPLPDFAALESGADAESFEEREAAVEMALATLEPHLSGRGGAAAIKLRGVLADALRAFALRGGGSLDGFVAMLASLPAGVSRIVEAVRLAAELADQLAAAAASQSMLRGGAEPFDPAKLFESSRGKTRVSVVNLSGLGGEAERRAFVNQLQMALFGWIKANPAPNGRLFVLADAQLYAPARETPACKRSMLALTKQARRYGLGMIFATADPRGLDPAILANSLTHFYGRVGSPASIEAVDALIAAKGGAAGDLARLKVGEFYYSTQGFSRPVTIRAPLSLTRRGQHPPTAAEVASLARLRA